MNADILSRRKTHFVLWRPANTNRVPELVIGDFGPGNPPELLNEQIFALQKSHDFPDVWELPAIALGLIDGRVYHYWFRIEDSNVYKNTHHLISITDPFATTVDWRLQSPILPSPYDDDDRDPASVVMFNNNTLIACDPLGELPVWSSRATMNSLPSNNHLVVYELPTRWTSSEFANTFEVAAGTFRDVRALVEESDTGANFEGLAVLRRGNSHLKQLGINALELLPPSDSFVDRAWGYATSNYLAADYNLGFPTGNSSPTATTDLVNLISSCHNAGIRFFADVVMAFATRAPFQNLNFLDFHIHYGTGDPEQGDRDGFGGDLMKYNYRVSGYDPLSGTSTMIVPARQWMKTFLTHWMLFYKIDGIRMDSVVNFNNWDFIKEFRDLARQIWRNRWSEENTNSHGAEERFLVIAEELAVPLDLIRQERVDALWNEGFQSKLREAILGGPDLPDESFGKLVEEMVDCSKSGFRDGAEAVNYITSHDVKGMRKERLYDFLENNGVVFKEKQIKLAFACLLTAVGIPMILAGEEFADQHDLSTVDNNEKQIDPVNYSRLEDAWRQDVFEYVSRLVHFRVNSNALAVNDTRFIHYDFTPGRRVIAWERGQQTGQDRVVVVANFSGWGTVDPASPRAEYLVNNWPDLPINTKWLEVTRNQEVPQAWAGREPLFPWEAKVYAMVPTT